MTGGIVEVLTGAVFKAGLSEAVKRVMGQRMEAARAVLQERLSRADIHIPEVADRDEAAAMVFAYIEAARQGAARRNLRMLADIMAGTLNSPPIYAEEFLRLSRVLAGLSQEEMVALAVLHRISLGIDDGTIPVDTARTGMAIRDSFKVLAARRLVANLLKFKNVSSAPLLGRIYLVRWIRDGRVFCPRSHFVWGAEDVPAFDQQSDFVWAVLELVKAGELIPTSDTDDERTVGLFCDWVSEWKNPPRDIVSAISQLNEACENAGLWNCLSQNDSIRLQAAHISVH